MSVQAAGRVETAHNLAIADLHNYHVVTDTGQAILVHTNGCEVTSQGPVNVDDLGRPTGVTAHLMPDMVELAVEFFQVLNPQDLREDLQVKSEGIF